MNTKHPLVRLVLDSRKQWIFLFLMAVSLTLNGVLQVSIARKFGEMVDYGVSGELSMLVSALFIIILLVVADCIRVPIHDRFTAHAMEGMFRALRIRVYSIILKTNVSVIEQNLRTGDVVTRISNDMDSLCDNLTTASVWHIRLIIVAIVAIINCFLLNWQISVVYFFLLPISLLTIRKISLVVEPQQKKASEATGKAMNLAAELLNSLMLIKSYSLENKMAERYAQNIDDAAEVSVASQHATMKMTFVKYIAAVIQLMVLFIMSTFYVSHNIMTLGDVLAFVAISTNVRSAFDISPLIISIYQRSLALCKRIYKLIELPVESLGKELQTVQVDEVLSLHGVSFRYENTYICHNLDISVRKNQKVGIIGPSGGGKSTIIKLICKFYEKYEGEIQIYGQSIHDISQENILRHIALVSQEPLLFDGSIYDNVRYGRLDATEEEVLSALGKVQLLTFVQSLVNGVNTQVGESGAKLSGGQRQRIAIARAILKDAPLILLDEATSALDNESEVEVQMALDELLVGKTAIIIAHRLSTLRNVDYIYCVDKEIIESGTPEELMLKKGYYHKMKLQQSERGEL